MPWLWLLLAGCPPEDEFTEADAQSVRILLDHTVVGATLDLDALRKADATAPVAFSGAVDGDGTVSGTLSANGGPTDWFGTLDLDGTYGERTRGGPAWVYFLDVDIADASYQATSVTGVTTWEAAVITIDQGDGPFEVAEVEVTGTLNIAGEDLPQDFEYSVVFSQDVLSLNSYLSIGGYVFNDFSE